MSVNKAQTEGSHPVKARKNRVLIAAIASLFALALVGVLLANHFNRPVTEAPLPTVDSGKPLATSPLPSAPSGPPVTNTPLPTVTPPEKPQMPADVAAYLQHLKQVEADRQNLKKAVESALTRVIKDLPAKTFDRILEGDFDVMQENLDAVNKTTQLVNQLWGQVIRKLDSVAPPQECRDLRDDYRNALVSVSTSVTAIQGFVASQDISSLREQRGSTGNIDDQFREANDELEAIYRKYDMKPEFKIAVEGGGQMPIFGF